MGAWGIAPFDNDIGCDWAAALKQAEDISFVSDTIATVLATGDDYLDLEVACEGLAACEVIAWLRGNWGKRDGYTEGVETWVRAHPTEVPSELVHRAVQAIDRIASPPSELFEDAGEEPGWQAVIADLRARVAG